MLRRKVNALAPKPSDPAHQVVRRKASARGSKGNVHKTKGKLISRMISWKFFAVSSLIVVTLLVLTVTFVLCAPVLFEYLLRIVLDIVDFWITDDSKVVPHIDSLTYEAFRKNYQHKSPVLFKSSMTNESRAEIYRLLTTEYKEELLNIGHVASLTIGGHGEWKQMTVEEYIHGGGGNFTEENPGYVFDLNLLPRLPKIERLIEPLVLPVAFASQGQGSVSRNSSGSTGVKTLTAEGANTEQFQRPFESFDDKRIFSIGNLGSGLGFHQHRQSYNDLFFGVKKWYLYRPDLLPSAGFSPWETQLRWLQEVKHHTCVGTHSL